MFIACATWGNVCQNGGSLTIENCTISHGVSHQTTNGGNIRLYGTSYVPTYVHNGETYGLNEGITAEELQNAAHQAVAEYRASLED